MTEPDEIAEAGRYGTLRGASERALVILAMGGSYWLFEDGHDWVLYTTVADLSRVRAELAAYERERTESTEQEAESEGQVPPLSLILYGWGLGLFFLVTRADPGKWTTVGAASSTAILDDGEWWRTVTALTLHSDLSHVAGNIAFGILFAAFLIPLLGTGATWFLVLATGICGNVLNAVAYHGSGHSSIGASTAVFGALGLLIGCRVQAAFRVEHPFRTLARRLVVPLGAGLALLAFLGTGGERTDYLAHLWGFLVGLPLGAVAMAMRIRERLPFGTQLLLAVAAPASCLCAWLLALPDAGTYFIALAGSRCVDSGVFEAIQTTMKKLSIIPLQIISVILLSSAGSAIAQEADPGQPGRPQRPAYSDIDKDGNGITWKEFLAAHEQRAKRMFQRMDADGDGTISEEEWNSKGQRNRRRPSGEQGASTVK